jgi:hypothetical protein
VTTGTLHGFRWRKFGPERAASMLADYERGVTAAQLAKRYETTVRTIYRTLDRAKNDRILHMELDGWSAPFALTDAGPIQLGPWVPKPSEAVA